MAVEIPNFGSHNRAIWLGLIAIGVAVGIYFRRRSQANAATDTTSGTPDMANVDGSTDGSYSSGDVQAIPGTQYGMPGPPGPPGPRGKPGKRGPRGAPPKHHKHKHHTPAGSHAQPRIAEQSHLASQTPVQSQVRVIQHRPGGVVQKGSRTGTNG